jgi:hypothetical protein
MGISGVFHRTPGGNLFAIIAAVVFAIAFVLDLAAKSYNNFINPNTLVVLGLVLLALHLAPLTSKRWRR